MLADNIFTRTMPLAKDFREAVASRLPVCRHKPHGVAARGTAAIAAELLERIVRHQHDAEWPRASRPAA